MAQVSEPSDWSALKALGRPLNLYFVRREQDIWRIVHQGHRAGAYASAEAAMAYACKLARESAGLGHPTAVIKRSDPPAFIAFPPKAVAAADTLTAPLCAGHQSRLEA